jgi:hypothetical protein
MRKTKNPEYIIEGTTKSGISFTLDTRVKDDPRFLHCLVKMQNKTDRIRQAKFFYEMLDMMFGNEDGVMAFENEIAKRHGGACTEKDLQVELQEIFEAMKLKNSSSSPTS